MCDVRLVEIESLLLSGVPHSIQKVWCVGVVVRSPLVEVIGDVKSCRIRSSVFEVNDDDLFECQALS